MGAAYEDWLNKSLADAGLKINHLEEEIESLKNGTRLAQLEKENADLKIVNHTLNQTIDHRDEKIRKLEDELSGDDSSVKELERDLDMAWDRNNDLEDELAEAKRQLKNIREKINEIMRTILV